MANPNTGNKPNNPDTERKPKRRKLDLYEVLVGILVIYLIYAFVTGGIRNHNYQKIKESNERSPSPK
jgi:capsule polysaccharide export protein KpsE/RkpR